MRMRLHCLLQRKKIEQELDDELQFHLQRQIEEYTAQGVSGEEARFAAARALGSLQQRKDECRDMRRLNWIDHLIQDLGYAVRTLRRSPGFTATVVLTLALGIGANTTIFSLINAILIRPMPFKDQGRLVLIWHKCKTIDATFGTVSDPIFLIYVFNLRFGLSGTASAAQSGFHGYSSIDPCARHRCEHNYLQPNQCHSHTANAF